MPRHRPSSYTQPADPATPSGRRVTPWRRRGSRPRRTRDRSDGQRRWQPDDNG